MVLDVTSFSILDVTSQLLQRKTAASERPMTGSRPDPSVCRARLPDPSLRRMMG
jgi:hypothetical protein